MGKLKKLKKIEAIIRKSRFEDVKKALLAADIEWFSYYFRSSVSIERRGAWLPLLNSCNDIVAFFMA